MAKIMVGAVGGAMRAGVFVANCAAGPEAPENPKVEGQTAVEKTKEAAKEMAAKTKELAKQVALPTSV